MLSLSLKTHSSEIVKFALAINLALLGSLIIVVVVAHHMYSMPPYQYLATDYGIQLLLFTHDMWTCGFLI